MACLGVSVHAPVLLCFSPELAFRFKLVDVFYRRPAWIPRAGNQSEEMWHATQGGAQRISSSNGVLGMLKRSRTGTRRPLNETRTPSPRCVLRVRGLLISFALQIGRGPSPTTSPPRA